MPKKPAVFIRQNASLRDSAASASAVATVNFVFSSPSLSV